MVLSASLTQKCPVKQPAQAGCLLYAMLKRTYQTNRTYFPIKNINGWTSYFAAITLLLSFQLFLIIYL